MRSCTFQALRDRLRCKEIWVVGADRWRNPDEDLPRDFEARRAGALRRAAQTAGPDRVHRRAARPSCAPSSAPSTTRSTELGWLEIADRGKQGAIKLTPLDAAPEPTNLRALKAEVRTRWGTVPLIDMLKEAVLRTGCLDQVTGACRAR